MRISRILLCICLTLEAATAQEVRYDARLQPETAIRAGQPLYYEIDVLTDTWFTGTPSFTKLQAQNTLITFEGSQGRTIQRTIEGKRYFGLSYRYRLVPLEPGVTTLPALQLEVSVGQSDSPVAVSVPARSFAVQSLPAAETAGIELLAEDVEMSQTLRPQTLSIQAGQPLVREIRIQARGALVLSIPRPKTLSTASLAATRLPAQIKALKNSRGHTTGGERIEQVRYLPEKPGTLILPALEIAWWDINENKVKQIQLPELEIEVTAAEQSLSEQLALAIEQRGNQINHRFPGSWAGLLITLAVVFLAVRHYRHSALRLLNAQISGWRQLWHNSRFRIRSQAIRELKSNPRALTNTYRLLQRHSDSHVIRYARMNPSSRQDLLDGLTLYYAPTPDPVQGRRKVLRALRHLAPRKRSK